MSENPIDDVRTLHIHGERQGFVAELDNDVQEILLLRSGQGPATYFDNAVVWPGLVRGRLFEIPAANEKWQR